jgi:cytochrome c oxidase assembly factor CtaG
MALLLAVVVLVPPLSSIERTREYAQAISFAVLAIAVPAFFSLAAPWQRLRLAAARETSDPARLPHSPGPLDRLAAMRYRHPEPSRSFTFLALYLVAIIAWRLPVSVNALTRLLWLPPLEALSLGITGLGLWLELIESPPLRPRAVGLRRGVLATCSMWTVWIVAYLLGMAHGQWYRAYHHMPGGALGLFTDQELSAALLWFASTLAFAPLIFFVVMRWLSSEETPDEELYRLVRHERRLRQADGVRNSERPESPGGAAAAGGH